MATIIPYGSQVQGNTIVLPYGTGAASASPVQAVAVPPSVSVGAYNVASAAQSAVATPGGTTSVSVNVPVSIPGLDQLSQGVTQINQTVKPFGDFFSGVNNILTTGDWLGWGVAALGIIIILIAMLQSGGDSKQSGAGKEFGRAAGREIGKGVATRIAASAAKG